MKRTVLLLMAAAMMTAAEAKKVKDPVIMTVAGEEIPLSEFIFIAKKDNSVDLKDKKSVANYMELFKNYKLKVADAKSLNMHKGSKFENELNSYKRQLQESFLSDKAGEDRALRAVYERTKFIPSFKHIMFRLPDGEIVSKDTVAAYEKAMAAYNRIMAGATFETVGETLSQGENDSVIYSIVDYVYPLQIQKVLEDQVFTMEPGEISHPVRSIGGFHIIKVDGRIPNPGRVRIAHILTPFPNEPADEQIEETRRKSDSIYQRVVAGEDFAALAKQYSADSVTGRRGGILPYFGLGEMVEPFEKTAFAFEKVGDVSPPVQTRFGFHVLKLLDRKRDISFEDMESYMYESMKRSERNFELYQGFDEKMKKRHSYVFHPEAYAELQRLADDYFPTDTTFRRLGHGLIKPLIRLDTIDFPQDEFVEYIYLKGASAKTYSNDYLREVFALFIRDIATEIERGSLEKDYPEFNLLIKEYYDGILLFEISDKRVWSHPAEEQGQLEAEWVKEVNEKYPVTVNRKVINKISKYID